MSHTSTLSPDHQTTLPQAVVEALQAEPSAILRDEVEPGGSVIPTAKSATFASLAGTFPRQKPARKATDEEIKAALQAEAVRRQPL